MSSSESLLLDISSSKSFEDDKVGCMILVPICRFLSNSPEMMLHGCVREQLEL